MKTSLWSLAALALMFMGCGSARNNNNQNDNNSSQVVENVSVDLDKPMQYEEPKENIVQKAAEQLLPEEYLEGLECQSKTVATVTVDDGETETIACYQRGDGSWLVMEYWPTQGPENDKLSVFVLGKDGKLNPGEAQNLPLALKEIRVSGNQLFFPYQGDELQFGNDYFIFPMEDGKPLRLEWIGEQFVVAK